MKQFEDCNSECNGTNYEKYQSYGQKYSFEP